MQFKEPENRNYAAVVVKVKSVTEFDNCENVVGVPLLGFQAIVSKDVKIGDMGIVFPAETQLSEEYASANSLFRHTELNADHDKKGYIEDNRRVKAMKFRGQRSDCLFMPLDSLVHTDIDLGDLFSLKEGDIFDQINGHEICKKYMVKTYGMKNRIEQKKKFSRVESKFLPEHYDTENFFRNRDMIPDGTEVIVTQKLHGTSIRIGNTVVLRELKWHEKLLRKLGVKISESGYDYVFGSRKVIKDANNPSQNHYYDTDIWTQYGKKLEGLIPQGFVLYGELVGFTDEGAEIQKDYTYDAPERTADLYIYRVAMVNPQGRVFDLGWDDMRAFCAEIGVRTVVELWRGRIEDFQAESFLDRVLKDTYPKAVKLSKKGTVDEGVCIRVDGIVPYILKAKSPVFLQMESAQLDAEIIDLETSQGEDGESI